MKAACQHQGLAVLGALALSLVAAWASTGRADAQAQPPQGQPVVKPSTERTLQLPAKPYRYASLPLPPHFNTPAARRLDNTPPGNPITDAGATLGRVLFYDTRLSGNNTVACASCHLQKHAFVDPNRFSKGFEGKLTDRHAPTLVDVRYYSRGRFFWDERARTLEDQILMPIQSRVEMGQDLAVLREVLSRDQHYPLLFKEAFGDSRITDVRISRAVAQFLRSMVSFRSEYDVGLTEAGAVNAPFANFTAQENRGKTLFLQRCATCHLTGGQSAHFFMNRPMNNGLDADIRRSDGGVGDITFSVSQLGLFKSPSLRNVEFTGPYMHDGRFSTLDQVIDHYSRGIKQHPNLEGRLRRPMNFNNSDKAALVAFLRTLTDVQFLTDPKYSDPFQ
jgi:cytochrome c peroxidase